MAESPLFFLDVKLKDCHPDLDVQPLLLDVFDQKAVQSVFEEHRPEVTPEVDPKIMGLPRYFWERGSLRSVNEYP